MPEIARPSLIIWTLENTYNSLNVLLSGCWGLDSRSAPCIEHMVHQAGLRTEHGSCSPMEFTLCLIYYVLFVILSFVSLEIPSLRTSESDLFTTLAC